ncbi:protein-disulfide reductase DsbD domain-containing protein [Thalassovita taeanensis]|uniref:Thiol-disulfide interchange protein, contains DsbC and DsbD domains n=1 Tax=Thalassovita taeanensis TaxID=657014 RepID=A0A1H9AT27_9RHOB|nr:protein-disulfide reductase DsbD domain-containing protein [Thalassovita taeanensis]SEP79685.1 Thiol-disulfide interchange protein, contains DsbC and DsbD domains [Thalassovita taeanensis]
MIKRTLLSLLASFAFAAPAAATNPYAEMVRLEVLPGWHQANGTHIAALRITLAPGWKTYWRAPGDAGIPPSIRWAGSRNLTNATPQWPTPVVFSQNGMRSVGYKHELILPLVLTPQNVGKPITLKGQLQIGICNDICVPADLSFDLSLPQGATRPDPAIASALASQPFSGDKAGLSAVHCAVSPTADGLLLSADITLPSAGAEEYAVVETADPQVWVAEAETSRTGNRLHVETQLMHVEGGAFALDRSGIRITVLGTRHAVDIQGCPAAP